MNTARHWIKKLGLQPHPEGGYYSETYRSAEMIAANALPSRYNSSRNFGTAIYFLLESGQISEFHRIQSDELWFFHVGSPIELFTIQNGKASTYFLGFEEGQQLQIVLPAQTWFGARVVDRNSFALVSCTVSPGFDFADFELADRQALLQAFPQHAEFIARLR